MNFLYNPHASIPDEGVHQVEIANISELSPVNVKNNPDPVGRVSIVFKTADGKTFSDSFLLMDGNTSLNRLVSATIGIPNDKVDLLDLVGERCNVKVSHIASPNGRVYANVTDAWSLFANEIETEIDELLDVDSDDEEIEEPFDDYESSSPTPAPKKLSTPSFVNRRKRDINFPS